MSGKVERILKSATSDSELKRDEIISLLEVSAPDQKRNLFSTAYEVKKRTVGPVVYFRGLIELSNRCNKDCYYCGIRKSNRLVPRFRLEVDEVVEAAVWAHRNGYGSLVLQGGELQNDSHTRYITEALSKIHAATNNELAATLSLGEQSREVLRQWREAGAHRYLLRMETSNQKLYKQFHPDNHQWESRMQCLSDLRSEDYQVGTGVLIGLPGQTLGDLADDLLYIRDLDVDMVGMGPFIPHDDTPLASHVKTFDKNAQLEMGLKMLSCTRLLLPDVNIAATTALQALSDTGRELGLQAGANVVMPNVTDPKYRAVYQLYNGKPSINENSEQSRAGFEKSISSIGETIGFGLWGNSPRYKKRNC
ncbi:MAG: [FeFe] hydrogenase H-cluster radical SAM maturase HydE [bacterium]|nr:[FeFe] hydrogenase H-cluster radical SAM maturase HydE [bacterium]MCP4800128.1 [FeFe] hydrogenase H-cluster radical SAM maturase HydE [bacterium]